jgi:UDP-N-acetylmuramoyl-L-alanyl-D-glutamate--2,6-diaminopimelate ligase
MKTLMTPLDAARWLRQRVTGELRTDSRLVQPGDAFIAWPGAATDGRLYLASALRQGAHACILAQEGSEPWQSLSEQDQTQHKRERMACMSNLKAQTGWLADAYYENPSDEISVLAVTGTNGKTSITWWLAQALSSPVLKSTCGLIGTLGVGQLPQLVSTGMTTPDPVLLQRQLREFADAGLAHCAIEASSIGLAEHRLDGVRIRVAVFTNFTQDHLDYHGSMDAYWAAKEALFNWPGLQVAVLNVDDPQGARLAQQLQARGLDVWTCSRQGAARLQARPLPSNEGLSFEVSLAGQTLTLQTGLIGDYNIDNLLGVIATVCALGHSLQEAVQACSYLTAVPGRMQRVVALKIDAPLSVVDYAHTPDAVEKALSALRTLADQRGGRLWCVLGCGGDRDPGKRPLMAAAAQAGADHVVLTSDNPRTESPEAILAAMAQGLKSADQATCLVDRAQAIAWVMEQAENEDVVLVAGKGHETYQEIQGVRQPFSDVEHVEQGLQRRVARFTLAAQEGKA